MQVTLLTESIDYEEFTIRELRLTKLSGPGQQPRTVLHFDTVVTLFWVVAHVLKTSDKIKIFKENFNFQRF